MKGIEPLTPSLPWKCSTPELHWQCQNRENRAGDETRTRDPQLGRLMLYQLSYARLLPASCMKQTVQAVNVKLVGVVGFEPTQLKAPDLQSGPALLLRRTPLFQGTKHFPSQQRDSNPRPADYKSAALPTELHRLELFL